MDEVEAQSESKRKRHKPRKQPPPQHPLTHRATTHDRIWHRLPRELNSNLTVQYRQQQQRKSADNKSATAAMARTLQQRARELWQDHTAKLIALAKDTVDIYENDSESLDAFYTAAMLHKDPMLPLVYRARLLICMATYPKEDLEDRAQLA